MRKSEELLERIKKLASSGPPIPWEYFEKIKQSDLILGIYNDFKRISRLK